MTARQICENCYTDAGFGHIFRYHWKRYLESKRKIFECCYFDFDGASPYPPPCCVNRSELSKIKKKPKQVKRM